MSIKKNTSNIPFESQSYSDDSYQNNIYSHIPCYNNISYNQNRNIISNGINQTILGDGNSIDNSTFNPSYLNFFNIPSINEIERPTNVGTKEENNQEEPIVKNENLKFTIMKPGRKKKSENAKSEHNKFSDDILRRKVKCIILKKLMKFINEKIYKMYDGNIGHNIFKKELLTINGNQNSNATIRFNQNFLHKKLGDIFSEKISTKYSNFDANHNKYLIQDLMNEEDEKKRKFFNNYFNLTFLQCLRHYIGEESIDVLNGLTCFNDEKNTIDEDEEYIEILDQYIKTYEKRIMKKKERPKRGIQKVRDKKIFLK